MHLYGVGIDSDNDTDSDIGLRGGVDMRFALLLLLTAWPLAVYGETVFLNGVAAVVDTSYITFGDIKARAWPQLKPLLSSSGGGIETNKLRGIYAEILDQMVEAKLIVLAFRDKGGEVSEATLEEKAGEFIREKFNNDSAKFREELENDGSSYDDWKEYLREQLIMGAMVGKEIESKIAISPHAVQAEYQRRRNEFETPSQNKVYLVEIGNPPGADDLRPGYLDALALKVREALAAGTSLDGVRAADPDAGRYIAEKDLGWIAPKEMKPEIVAAISGLKAGSVSAVVAIGDRRYIARIMEQKPGAVIPFGDVQKGIERELRRKTFDVMYKNWIDTLRSRYHVTVNSLDPLL